MPSEPDNEPQSSPEIEILNSNNAAENTENTCFKEKEKTKKKPYVTPLKLESLLKSFFAEEIRDLSCEKCNFPSSKAKVRSVEKCLVWIREEKRSGGRRSGGRKREDKRSEE